MTESSSMLSDWVLPQRARFAVWTPIIMLLLLIPLSITPFAEIERNSVFTDTNDEQSESNRVENFYPEYIIIELTSDDYASDNNSHYFGGEVEEKRSYEYIDQPQSVMERTSADLESEIGVISTLTIILIIFCLVNQKERLQFNKYLNYESFKGLILLGISLYCIFAFFSITSGLSDFSDEVNREYSMFFGENVSVDEGIWGSAEYEFEFQGFGSIESKEEWGPDLMLLVLIPCIFFSLIGSLANFSYLKSDLEINDEDPYFGFESHLSKPFSHVTLALSCLLILSVIGSMIMPWHSIQQTWEMEKNEQEYQFGGNGWVTTDTTFHTAEFSWNLNPFYLDFNNDTSLDTYDNFDGEKTSSFDSYSEHPELSQSSKPVLELRWPIICVAIVGLFFFANRYIEKFGNYVAGENKSWTILILISLMLLYSLGGIGSYDEQISKEIDEDTSSLSPSIELYPLNISSDSSSSGSILSTYNTVEYNYDFTPSGWFQESTEYIVLTEWSPSLGYYSAQLVPIVIISLLAMILGPELFRQLNNYEAGFELEFDRNSWVARPTILAVCGILLTSILGTGLGELVVDSKSAAPKALKMWILDWDNSDLEDGGRYTMSHNMEIVFEYNPDDLGYLSSVRIDCFCEEGSSPPTLDAVDRIIWELTPPDGINRSSLGELSGEIDCDNEFISIWWNNQFKVETSYAANEEEFLEGLIFDEITGPWVLEVKAETNGGLSEFDSDEDLSFTYDFDFRGRNNFSAISA